jgi:hypothetical protein
MELRRQLLVSFLPLLVKPPGFHTAYHKNSVVVLISGAESDNELLHSKSAPCLRGSFFQRFFQVRFGFFFPRLRKSEFAIQQFIPEFDRLFFVSEFLRDERQVE